MSGWMCTSLPSRKRGATVCVAVAESGRGGAVRQIGVFENRTEILVKLAARLSKGGRRRWLTTVRFAHPAQQIVLQDYIHAVQASKLGSTG